MPVARAALIVTQDAGLVSYQPRERLTKFATASITGTSISTPTTVASAAPDSKPNRRDRRGHRQFEEVARADQRRRTGDAVWRAQRAVEEVRQPRVEEHLDQDRHRQQQDHERLAHESARPGSRTAIRAWRAGRVSETGCSTLMVCASRAKPCFAAQDRAAHEVCRCQRRDDIERDRQQQGVPRYGDGRQAQQQPDDRREGDDHEVDSQICPAQGHTPGG